MKRLTKSDIKFIERHHEDMEIHKICQCINKPYNRVYWYMWKRNMTMNLNRPSTKKNVRRRILTMYCEGFYVEDISAELKTSIGRCNYVVNKVFGHPATRKSVSDVDLDTYTDRPIETEENRPRKFIEPYCWIDFKKKN